MQNLLNIKRWPWIFVAVTIAFLSACGGGGDEPLSEAAAPINTRITAINQSLAAHVPESLTALDPEPLAAEPVTVQLEAASSCALADFQKLMLERVNAYRAAGGSCGGQPVRAATALQWNSAVFNAAAVHSQDMAGNHFFAHVGPTGSSPGDRLNNQGYQWSMYAENITAGHSSVASAVDAWMASSAHCQNIMNASASELGAACVVHPSDPKGYGSYWTMVLARP